MSQPNLLLLLSGEVGFDYIGSGGIIFGGAALTAPTTAFIYVGSGGIIFGGGAESMSGPIWGPTPPASGGWTPTAPSAGGWAPVAKPVGPWVPVGG